MKKVKKLTAVLLMLVMLLTTLPLSVFASEDINLGEEPGNSNINITVVKQYGHELHTTTINGRTYPLFCTEYGKKSPSNSTMGAQGVPNDANLLEAARWIFAGYYWSHGNNIDYLDMAYCQKKVWSVMGWNTSWDFSDAGYNAWVANAYENIQLLNTYPSFDDQSNFRVVAGKSITISDANNVFKYYPAFDYTENDIRYIHNTRSNELVIMPNKTCNSYNFRINRNKFKKTITGQDQNCLLYNASAGGTQTLLYSAYYDPVTFSVAGTVVPLGNINITKKDIYDASLTGAEFGLYSDKACSKLITTATSKNGSVKFDYLEPGTYYSKETKAPKGYLLNKTVLTLNVTSNNTTNSTIKDAEPTGTITVTKKLDVSKTNNRYGDVKIDEAEYTLYAAEQITSKAGSKVFYNKDDVVSTKKVVATDGTTATTTWDKLPLGSYYVKETKAPTGTFIDEKEHSASVEYKDQNTEVISTSTVSVDTVKSQKVKVFKAGTDGSAGEMKGVSDAQFSIKLNADYTNAINQGYKLEEIWASADSNGNYKGIDINGNVVTVDKTRATEAQKVAPSYVVITSNKDGYAVSSYLPFGKYIMKETSTPKDYIAGNDVVFNIEKDESEYEIENAVKNININNALFESPVKIIKKDVDSNKPVTLSSASYKIRATQDVINRATGKVIYHKGDYVQVKVGNNKYNVFKTNSDNLTSMQEGNVYASKNDEKGSVTTPFKLQAGYYEIVEVESPDGFLIDTKPVPFVVTNTVNLDKDADGDVISIVTQSNKQPKANIQINKSFELREDDVDTSLISKDENGNINNLDKVTFELTAADTITDKTDGRVVYNKGDIVATKSLTNGKTIKFNNLWIGSYIVKEISTIDGAVLDTTEYSVVFETKDNTTEQYYQTLDITNYTTEIDVSKVDSTGTNEIAGANLTITDENGNVVDTWVSTTEIHKIEGLKVGKTYTLTEDMSPLGYNIANSIEFTVQNNKEIQKVSMTDNTVKVNKVDNNGNLLQGATLQVVSAKTKNIIDKWVTGQHIFDVTEDMLASIKENGSVENMYVDEDDATVLYKIVSNNNSKDYTLMLVKDGEVNYYCIDNNGNETSHMIRGLQEDDEYRLVELQAPDKYVVANSIEFTTENKDIELSLTNKQVQISKTDITTGEELEGAKLTITDKDGNVVDEWTSTKEPHFASGLIEGQSYTLTEVSAPYGFTVAESIEFTVSADKETQKIVMKDDYIYSSVRVVKCDKTTKKAIKSNAFEFSIFADKDCTKLIATSGANKDDGSALFEKLKYGTYYIKETKAPLGYSLSDQVVEIVINDKGVFADGKNLEEKDGIYSFEYFDELLPIVQTGDNNNIKTIGIISGVLAVTILALVCVIKRLKKAKENNAEQK